MQRVQQLIETGLASRFSLTLRISVWVAALIVATMLAAFRVATDAEYAVMSFVVVPVIAIAWVAGGRQGILFAVIATALWLISDPVSDTTQSATWVSGLNALTRLGIYALVAGLIGMLRKVLQREQQLARCDVLTGLMNRRAFFDIGQAEVERARRYGHPIAVAFLDLDNFKTLNDTRGHDVGDAVLKRVAQIMLDTMRKSDRISRLGGDEFAIILPETVARVAEEIGAKLAEVINSALKKDFFPVTGQYRYRRI